jgi:hypothetical protein
MVCPGYTAKTSNKQYGKKKYSHGKKGKTIGRIEFPLSAEVCPLREVYEYTLIRP